MKKNKVYAYIGFRPTQDVENKIKSIMDARPDLYPNKSMVVRAAIMYFFNERGKK